MPDTRSHRGQHPKDSHLFQVKEIPRLREAAADLSWLRSREYSDKSALKLVGDRYNLVERQRLAVLRSACSDQSLTYRKAHEIPIEECCGKSIEIDGYNLLITIESALSGGFLFEGRDGCYRDLASVHGTYRKVEETIPALIWIGAFLSSFYPNSVLWYFDSPVSNSGHLKQLVCEISDQYKWDWKVEIVTNPDSLLLKSDAVIVTTDSWILDRTRTWTNLARGIIENEIPDAKIVSFFSLDA